MIKSEKVPRIERNRQDVIIVLFATGKLRIEEVWK